MCIFIIRCYGELLRRIYIFIGIIIIIIFYADHYVIRYMTGIFHTPVKASLTVLESDSSAGGVPTPEFSWHPAPALPTPSVVGVDRAELSVGEEQWDQFFSDICFGFGKKLFSSFFP